MFEDILEEKTVTVDNISIFQCVRCNMYIQMMGDLRSVDCPICGRILLNPSLLSYPLINKNNDYFGTTVSC